MIFLFLFHERGGGNYTCNTFYRINGQTTIGSSTPTTGSPGPGGMVSAGGQGRKERAGRWTAWSTAPQRLKEVQHVRAPHEVHLLQYLVETLEIYVL